MTTARIIGCRTGRSCASPAYQAERPVSPDSIRRFPSHPSSASRRLRGVPRLLAVCTRRTAPPSTRRRATQLLCPEAAIGWTVLGPECTSAWRMCFHDDSEAWESRPRDDPSSRAAQRQVHARETSLSDCLESDPTHGRHRPGSPHRPRAPRPFSRPSRECEPASRTEFPSAILSGANRRPLRRHRHCVGRSRVRRPHVANLERADGPTPPAPPPTCTRWGPSSTSV
jgi:hypothetical protein